jgi:hypothetical protein
MTWKGGFDGKCLSRDQFLEHVRSLKWDAWRPSIGVCHSTGAPNLKQWMATRGGESQRIKNLAHYYQTPESEGGPRGGPWTAGPHVFVSPSGIFLGTPLTRTGINSPSWNSVSFGVEMAGNYDVEPFEPLVRDNTVHVFAVVFSRLGVLPTPQTFRLHAEDTKTNHKQCPGRNVKKPDMIKRITDAMAALHPGGHELDAKVA